MILGESGAGKSTLLNALLGHDTLATGGVRERDDQGRHTTVARVMVALPDQTNTDFRPEDGANKLDKTLWARNKWLLAHPDSSEAKQGAAVLLKGENIDIAGDI